MFLNFGLHFNTVGLLMLYTGESQRSLLCILLLFGSDVYSLIRYGKARWRSTWRPLADAPSAGHLKGAHPPAARARAVPTSRQNRMSPRARPVAYSHLPASTAGWVEER